MLEHFFKSQRMQVLREGPHGSLLEGFARELCQAGYGEVTIRRRFRAAKHLLHWMDCKRVPVSDFTEDLLKRFGQHRCRCVGFGPTLQSDLFAGARLFLNYLRSTGSTSIEPNQAPPLLVAFLRWMRQQRGSCDDTLYHYGSCIRALLKRLGEDPSRFDAQGLRQFVLETSQQSGWARTKKHTTALRMFLRFLISEGKCAASLEAAIPTLAHWRLSSLPRYLPPEDVERIIYSCDRSTPVGRRDRAILLLLARLGLRAGDIVHLRLADIDWKEAAVRVSGKGGRETQLPLTQEVGDAIVNYLKTSRPKANTDVMFPCLRAPFHPFASSAAVSTIVTRAMYRAGVSCSGGAAHVLRHSAATAMLRHGASLQDIANVLRHRSIVATEIYAKVDVTALKRIAQAWPEVQPC